MTTRLMQIVGLKKKGFKNSEIAEKFGISRGGVGGQVCVARKRGLLPPIKEEIPIATRVKRKYTKKKKTPTIVQMPIEEIQAGNDSFIIIVGKGEAMLTSILNKVRMA